MSRSRKTPENRDDWRWQALDNDLGMPEVKTLENSYAASDAWIIDVELLLRQGMARLRKNFEDVEASILIAEAYRRLLAARWRRQRQKNESTNEIGRLFSKITGGKEKRTAKEIHDDELESLAVGILYSYGYQDHIDVMVASIRNDLIEVPDERGYVPAVKPDTQYAFVRRRIEIAVNFDFINVTPYSKPEADADA